MYNFEEKTGCCSPVPELTSAHMPKETIKDTVGDNYKVVCEIDYVLRAIVAQTFGVDEDKLDNSGGDTLEATLMRTNKLLHSVIDKLYLFANRMGVET